MKKKTNKEKKSEFFSVDYWKTHKKNSVYGKAFKEATDDSKKRTKLTNKIMPLLESCEDIEFIDKWEVQWFIDKVIKYDKESKAFHKKHYDRIVKDKRFDKTLKI